MGYQEKAWSESRRKYRCRFRSAYIVSAYLIAAFISGEKLTTQQIIIISALFVFAAFLMVWSIWGLGSRIVYTAEALRHINPEYPIIIKNFFRNSLTIVCALGVIASLKFMWDVRHPKTG